MRTFEELENTTDALNELIEHHEALKERENNRVGVRTTKDNYHCKCPRCGSKTKISSAHPYCPECNWDSLTDLSLTRVG